MNPSADAAEQIVRVGISGSKYAITVTSKGSLATAKLIARAVSSAMKQKNKTKGTMRLNNLLHSGKKLDIAEIAIADIKRFAADAKKYGVLYTVIKDKSMGDGVAQIMFRSDDKEKVNMIFKKLGKTPEYMAEMRESIEKELNANSHGDKPAINLDDFVDELMRKPEDGRSEKESRNEPDPHHGNPETDSQTTSRTAESPRSENGSEGQTNRQAASSDDGLEQPERKSVRKELEEIKAEMERKKDAEKKKQRTKNKSPEHKNPGKKKPKKNKER